MAKTVLIVIDNSKRELFGCSLLARYLKDLGIKPVMCSRFNFRAQYAHLEPDGVTWPNALVDLSAIAEKSFVFVLPSESGNGQPEQVRATHAGTSASPAFPERIDRFFCWGSAMREMLIDTGRWREEQLTVTGSPSTDHWLLPRSGGTRVKPRVGVTTTFRVVSAPPNKANLFRWLDETERFGFDGTYYEPPEHAESWLFFEASVARSVAGLVRTLAVDGAAEMSIRPHPLDQKYRYEYFHRISGGRAHVTKAGTISEWLSQISVLFTYLSASALDALIRGVPVVSIRGLLDRDALRKIPGSYRYPYEDMLWQIEDLHQAVSYVERAAAGDLRPCLDEEGFATFLSQHFAFPRSAPAAQLMAQEIAHVLDHEPSRKRVTRSWGFGRRNLPIYLPLRDVARYLYGQLPGHRPIGFSYQSWRLRERWAAMRAADRVYAHHLTQKREPVETLEEHAGA